ncbi:MAG: ADP-ribosyl-[dinitrogen reductase] hydrolase [Flavobacteriales bacterium]|jgi:ADP-ribosyl-[dinitrogen reductase] hydrolase
MLLQAAIGDAYGAGFEFALPSKIKSKKNLSQYETHPLYKEIKGKYTDDTQMAIGIAELLIEEKDWTSLMIANKFVEVFKRDPRRGYAKRFQQFLTDIKDGQEMLDKIVAKSERNGAAMRAYPLGILKDEKEIIEKCDLQSSITHQTEKALLSPQAIALSNHYFIYKKGKKGNPTEYLQDIQQYKWKGDWSGEVKVNAIETVEAVITVLRKEHSLKEMLRKSVDFGGDVDTVAASGCSPLGTGGCKRL